MPLTSREEPLPKGISRRAGTFRDMKNLELVRLAAKT